MTGAGATGDQDSGSLQCLGGELDMTSNSSENIWLDFHQVKT